MQTLRGKGKIFDSKETFLGEVDYDIYYISSTGTSEPEWRGEITPANGIMPAGDHIIELDDGRRGRCVVRIKTSSSFGLVVDSFDVEGTNPLA